MTLTKRIELLAVVLADFPEMRGWDISGLTKLVKKELGAVRALDAEGEIVPDLSPRTILHIISANTPMAGIQSLVRGLLLGSRNFCKIPSGGLPRFVEFVEKLPAELRESVDFSSELSMEWVSKADAIIVFGSDETVARFRKLAGNGQTFAGYGNRWSGAVIFEDNNCESVAPLAEDIGLYNQMGCLSVQLVWLHEGIDAEKYGECLAEALRDFSIRSQPARLDPAEALSIAHWRSEAEWRAVQGVKTRFWWSDEEPTWGIHLDGSKRSPSLSCLHRHVRLIPWTSSPHFGDLESSLSSLSIWPFTGENEKRLHDRGASRICPVGEAQYPPPDWQQDGYPALGRLLRGRGVG